MRYSSTLSPHKTFEPLGVGKSQVSVQNHQLVSIFSIKLDILMALKNTIFFSGM
jgi:hypothetical protein